MGSRGTQSFQSSRTGKCRQIWARSPSPTHDSVGPSSSRSCVQRQQSRAMGTGPGRNGSAGWRGAGLGPRGLVGLGRAPRASAHARPPAARADEESGCGNANVGGRGSARPGGHNERFVHSSLGFHWRCQCGRVWAQVDTRWAEGAESARSPLAWGRAQLPSTLGARDRPGPPEPLPGLDFPPEARIPRSQTEVP